MLKNMEENFQLLSHAPVSDQVDSPLSDATPPALYSPVPMSAEEEEEIRSINAMKMHHRMNLSQQPPPTNQILSFAVDRLESGSGFEKSVCMVPLNGPQDVSEYLQKVRWRIMAETAPIVAPSS